MAHARVEVDGAEIEERLVAKGGGRRKWSHGDIWLLADEGQALSL